MPDDCVTELRPTGSITNLPIIRNSAQFKPKAVQAVPPGFASSDVNGDLRQANALLKNNPSDQHLQANPKVLVNLPREDVNKLRSTRKFRAHLPWLDGKPSSVTSEEKVRGLHLPGAFEPESPTSSSGQSSRDMKINLSPSAEPPKAESSTKHANEQGRASLPWIKRPDGLSSTLSSTNISPSTPMVRSWQNAGAQDVDDSVIYNSSGSSAATTEMMSIPIDVRKLEAKAVDITAQKAMFLQDSGSSSTPNSSDNSTTQAQVPEQNQLPYIIQPVDRVTDRSATSFNDVRKEEPVKVIDFVQGANEIYRKASNVKGHHRLMIVDPTPISDASSLSSSLAYDLNSVASVDVEMEGSIRQAHHHHSHPNFSNRDILKSPDIRIGESARSFRRKSGLAISDPIQEGEDSHQSTYLQGRSAKRVSFHPNLPLNIQITGEQEMESHKADRSDLFGASDIRRRHGKHNSIRTPPRSSSLKNLDAAQKDAAADSSAHKYVEERDGLGYENLEQPQNDYNGESRYRSEEGAGISIYQKKPNHRETGFSFRRYKHRPVARNWKNQRKRLVAAVACLNTGLLGYIVGIYVS